MEQFLELLESNYVTLGIIVSILIMFFLLIKAIILDYYLLIKIL